MATIKEVAEKAGVSAATVSYVLNDSRKVRPETEQRVLWAAKELGYLPNTAARSLAVGRSSILGLIVADIANPFFPEIAKSFQLEASLYGLETLVMDSNKDPRRTRNLVERLLGLQVPGIAFLTSQVDAPVKEFMAKKGICAAYLGFGSAGPKIANIAIEQTAGHHGSGKSPGRSGPSQGGIHRRPRRRRIRAAAQGGLPRSRVRRWP